LGEVPVIGLTATADPKSSGRYLENLEMSDATTFKASFNRPNLYYEVRTKQKNVESDIIRFIKQQGSRNYLLLKSKKVEAIAQVLQVNGISAVPYHAGLDAKHEQGIRTCFLWRM
jgi:ATP-dependent DNA helicase RecQ